MDSDIAFSFNYRSGSSLLTRHITNCQAAKIRQMFDEGHGINTISRETKMGYSLMIRIFKKMGLHRTMEEGRVAKKAASELPKTGRFANLK